MSLSLLAIYCVLVLTLARTVIQKNQPYQTPSCTRCGLPRERRELGGRICGCAHG